jgi:hypothetical protein
MSEPTPPAPPPSGSSDAGPEPETTGLADCAPTEAGPAATEDTLISPPTPDPVTVEAWSDETEPIDRDPQTWRKTWVMAAILALAGIVFGAAVWFGHLAWPGSGQSSHPAPAPASSPTPTTNAPPPPAPAPAPTSAPTPAPPATTVQASPSTVPAPPPDVGISPEMVAWYDRQFIANLTYNGARITDPVALAHQAHRACAMLQKGATQGDVIQKIVAESGWNYFTATMFVSTAMSTYPSCP